MQGVFVCYRRADSLHVAGRLRDRLEQALGAGRVFMDVHDIEIGEDFRVKIRSTLSQVDVVLVLIGPRWDPGRLRDPHDFVRLEITEALVQERRVIPVLLDGAEMPASTAVPESVAELCYRNATPLRPDPDFHGDVDRMLRALQANVPVAQDARPSEAPAPPLIGRALDWANRKLDQRASAAPKELPPPVPLERTNSAVGGDGRATSSGTLRVIRRKQTYFGRNVGIRIMIDGAVSATLKNGATATITVPSGVHRIEARGPQIAGMSAAYSTPLTIDVAPNETMIIGVRDVVSINMRSLELKVLEP